MREIRWRDVRDKCSKEDLSVISSVRMNSGSYPELVLKNDFDLYG